jgi:DNA-binding response OmpR family regulator
MKEILLIEDDINLNNSIAKILVQEGFVVHSTHSLKEAREINKKTIDLIILDWMLPDGQGIDFLRETKNQNAHIPVIMLTARNDLIDKVLGLETGANDYMTKPFEPRELIARIRVQLRDKKQSINTQKKLQHGHLTLDPESRDAFFRNNKINFTKMEFDLLVLLVENPNKTFTRENLLDKVWGYENYPTTRTVDNHVLQIRQKTDEQLIETVRGLGYRLSPIPKEFTQK